MNIFYVLFDLNSFRETEMNIQVYKRVNKKRVVRKVTKSKKNRAYEFLTIYNREREREALVE